MKILHIGDVHLGCTLENQRRNGEIAKAFDHLAGWVREQAVQAVLIAGDVFDKGSPSNESQELYYRFLLNLRQAGCRQVVVIAGNHDSARFLEAPQALLKQMDIHVVGSASPDDPGKEVIALGSADAPEAYVCAVPFLSERDVRHPVPEGESAAERDAAIARGIARHYRDVFRIADERRNGRPVPIIAMGHLYVSGASFAADGDPAEPVGNLNPVDLADCAEGYAYVALGHLHKPQTVGNHENWRYAGSILPMNLRESGFTPQVVLLDSADPAHPVIHEIPRECFHEMKVIRGGMEELRARLNELDASGREIWVKAVYTAAEIRPDWAIELRQEFRDRKVRILLAEVRRQNAAVPPETGDFAPEKTLAAMTPEELFLRHLRKKGDLTDPEQLHACLQLFRSAMAKVCDPAEQKEAEKAPVRRGVMRFERLYLKNVNSLYGENLIDFTAPEFNEGIFLISGNTGAGKSSILDAICLALFGATPRVSDISNQRDSVISEGAREIKAELTFSLDGRKYRACFQHRRTGSGKTRFSRVQHFLYENDRSIAETPTDSKNQVTRLIGMDRAQFCRCVLLAQGSFDAFLKSAPQERADILKNITGTEIFSRIGRQINQDYNDAKNQYELALRELHGITLLDDEARKERQQRLQTLSGQRQACVAELQKREAAETLFREIERAQQELQKAAELVAAAEKRRLLAMPRRQELADANSAQNCEKPFRQLQTVRQQRQALEKELATRQTQQPLLEKQAAEQRQKYAARERELAGLADREARERKVFQAVRRLDDQIAAVRRSRTAADHERSAAEAARQSGEREFQAVQQKWDQARKEAEAARTYCGTHAQDAELPQLRIGWELRRQQLAADEKRNADDARQLDAVRSDLVQKRRGIALEQKQLQTAEAGLQAAAAALEKRRRELAALLLGKSCRELRESWAAAVKLDELFRDSVQRQEYLTAGKPCPLCGSVQHPYCEGTPVPDGGEFATAARMLKEKLDKVEACRQEITRKELEMEKRTAEIAGARRRIAEAEAAAAEQEKNERERRRLLDERCRNAAALAASLAEELQARLQVPWSDHAALPEALGKRISAFARMQKVVDSLEEDRNAYEKAAAGYAVLKPQLEERCRRAGETLAGLDADLQQLERERAAQFGAKKVEEEEKRLNEAVAACRKERDQAAAEEVRIRTQVQQNREALEKYGADLEALTAVQKRAESEFLAALRQYGFASPEDFAAKRREPQQIQLLTAEMQQIDHEIHAGQGAYAERRKMRNELLSGVPEGVERESNLLQLRQLQHRSAELQTACHDAELELKQDEAARAKSAEKTRKVAELGGTYNHWKYLDEHFGTTAGTDRFGKIAQGYTFSELLYFANRNRLRPLQRHFTLVNDADDPLELNVIDHYRGDLVRTAKNLSGGETFEVSLALALGLAEMSAVSQNASLGNVLLDEGFGTLDEDVLDSALELLMQLQRTDRKLVGIISHVGKLKERIHTRIEVTGCGGMGFLAGAGVVRLPQGEAADAPKKRGGKAGKSTHSSPTDGAEEERGSV